MPDRTPPRPPAEAGDRGARPLGKRNTKIFVTAVILFAIAFAVFTVYMVVRTANDPDIQEGIEEYRRDTGQESTTPESTAPDTTID